MQLTQEQLERYAKKYARYYIAKYGRKLLLDEGDAFSTAFIALAQNNEFDESRSIDEIEHLLYERAIGAIVNEYNRLYKTHYKGRKQVIQFSELDEDESGFEDSLSGTNAVEPDSFDDTIKLGLSRLPNKLAQKIVASFLLGEKQVTIADKFEVSQAYVSKICKKFRNLVKIHLESLDKQV